MSLLEPDEALALVLAAVPQPTVSLSPDSILKLCITIAYGQWAQMVRARVLQQKQLPR